MDGINTKGIKAITDKNICMKCLNKKSIHRYTIHGRGYGSMYDDVNTYFQLCNDCANIEYEKWVNETPTHSDYVEEYKFESNIDNFINSLPLESQELFANSFANGAGNPCVMKPQDWIDYRLGELPHKKCKQYSIYSKEEINAYNERFPNCDCVSITVYNDGSRGSSCLKCAFGDGEGNVGSNISKECYMCDCYFPRKDKLEIKIIDEVKEYYKNEKYRLIHMLQYASTRLRELEDNKELYMEKHK